jgi:hypothetical protein
MDKIQVEHAKTLLADRAERLEVCGMDTGGLCLTAYWVGGGQQIFYSLDSIEAWLADRESV